MSPFRHDVARGVVASALLGCALPGCVDRPLEVPELDVGSSSDPAPDDVDDDSTTGGMQTACLLEDRIDGLGVALAWHEGDALRVNVQSLEGSCFEPAQEIPPGHSRIELLLPVGVDPPTAFEATELAARARIAPGGPGSRSENVEVAWLDGELLVTTVDDDRLVATLHDSVIPFVGCFEARVCSRR